MSKYLVALLLAAACCSCRAQDSALTSRSESPQLNQTTPNAVPTTTTAAINATVTLPSVWTVTATSPTNATMVGTVTSTSTTTTTTEGPLQTTAKKAKQDDPLQSKICQLCRCQDVVEPFLVDCSAKDLKESFLDSDWPSNTSVLFMKAVFDSNSLTEIHQFPKLPLSSLSFRKNSIQIIQSAAFKALESLEHLDLSKNNLTHESLYRDVFEGPFSDEEYEPIPLKTLKLGYNQIHSIDKDAFDHLPFIEILEINNNPLEVLDHQTAIAITTLRKLKVKVEKI